ncbi:hypothetical protein BLNAU_18996 [Blattamonas nauphoetae]|uniref:Uncharacterized protein n=1 Tax=Blattamonas nauphoetae TaxID=2049346 RepID=A0ABQ9X2U1_9EUKA|nr:hypothetical protein BLNAU_18996 [Blattamonas nauphoetae]
MLSVPESLTTPPGPTLTEIKADLNGLNLNEAEVSVKVSPCAAGDFTLLILDDSDEGKPEISIGPFSLAVSSTESTSSQTVLIHGSEKLSYGKTYTVKMLSSSTVIVSHSGETVEMPDAPARISFANPTLRKIEGTSGSTSTTCSVSEEIYNKTGTLEDEVAETEWEKTEVSVVVTGVGLTSSISKIVVKNGNKKFSSSSVEFKSTTELLVKFKAGKAESETELKFDTSYEIESVSEQSGMFLNSGVGFTVPLPGIVTSTSTEPNSTTHEHFKVIVKGENFVSGSEWTLKLKDRNEEISVTMKSETMGESSWVKGGGLNEIEFGKTYALWTMTETSNSSEHVVCAGVSLTTPPGPTLTEIKADLNGLNLNEAEVSVKVSPCAAGDFTLLILDDSDEGKPEISIGPFSLAVSSTESTSSQTVLIHGSEKLSYGKTYTVKMLSSSTVIVSHSGETVEMPDAPARISFANPTLSGVNKTFVTLSLTGEALPCDSDFTIVVKEMVGDVIKEGASGISLTGKIEGTSGSTSTTCSVSEEIYNKTGTLEYSLKYKIVSLSIVGLKCIVDPTAIFEVLDSPGRVEEMKSPKLNGRRQK